jgi:hypothetical protein
VALLLVEATVVVRPAEEAPVTACALPLPLWLPSA